MGLLLLIVLVLLCAGSLPMGGWHDYGYYPAGGLGLVVLVLLILILLGRI